jgi:hypothetical protein
MQALKSSGFGSFPPTCWVGQYFKSIGKDFTPESIDDPAYNYYLAIYMGILVSKEPSMSKGPRSPPRTHTHRKQPQCTRVLTLCMSVLAPLVAQMLANLGFSFFSPQNNQDMVFATLSIFIQVGG